MLSCTEDDSSDIDSFENLYYGTLSLAQHILESRRNARDEKEGSLHSARSACSNSCSHHNLSNIKLPTIKLPTFDGNYLKWLEFRDTFDSLIHSNETISDINKFHYLRSSLEGGAALIIKSLEFSSKNYTIAWNLICERYDNKKILINNHLKALFEIESITNESHRAIRFLIDHVLKSLRALNTLEQPTDKWDIFIIYLVSTKLDSITFSKWEEHKNTFNNLPELSDFITFLRNSADILETMAVSRSEKHGNKFNLYKNNYKKPEPKVKEYYHNKTTKSFVTSANTKFSRSCPFCNQQHRIIDCPSFKQLSPEKKCVEVSKLNLCLNCLRRGHASNECRLLGTCKICRKKHNTLLHVDSPTLETNTSLSHCSYVPVSLPAKSAGQVLLGTALIEVINPENNNTYLARALLDAGSQSSFVTEQLKEHMGLIGRNMDTLCVSGINNCKTSISNSCHLTIKSRVNNFSAPLKCLVVPKITGLLPNTSVHVTNLNLPQHIQLADPKFFRPSDVDLLLGAEIFFELMLPNQIKLGSAKPVLQESKLGWIVAGPLYSSELNENRQVHCNFTKDISDQLTRFWSLEEVPSSKPTMSADDQFCERYFTATTKRLEDGRFSVFIPFKESPEVVLGDSFFIAKKRFLSLERKLKKTLI
ncbi:uncharacterized protein LOC134200893 isoform X1 [Bombyx mori]|uniref:uncharacterized protein LOC134200893 isoform X1 n=1 Tax=Bombyx mori TaxID=7091 RepID=UPI002ED4599A